MGWKNGCQLCFYNRNNFYKGFAVLLFLLWGVSASAQTIAIGNATVVENVLGSNMVFTVTAINVPSGASVSYSFPAGGTATGNGVDYTGTLGGFSFSGSSIETRNISVPINNDNIVEGDETFTVQLSVPIGATLSGTGIGTGTIINDDKATVTLSDVSGAEDGGPITVKATLDNPVAGGFTVFVSTSNGTATFADNDYTPVTNFPLNFAGRANESQTFNVLPTADNVVESDETIMVSMGGISGTTLAADIDVTATAEVTINNDDSSLSIGPGVSHPEGDTGGTPFVFTVTRTGDTSVPASATCTVTGTGTDPTNAADFVGNSFPTNTVPFLAGSAIATIPINVSGDMAIEADETFTVTLSAPSAGATIGTATSIGTITDDDGNTISMGAGVSHPEGDSGPMVFNFTVSRTGDTSGAASATYTVTGSGTNPANATDFVGNSFPTNTVPFLAGSAIATIPINVSGDVAIEPDETFTVTLSAPSPGAILGTPVTSIGTISNEDSCASGPTAPVLDTSVPTAYCDVISRDLDDYTNSPIPPNSVLAWSTNSDPTVVADHLAGSIATTVGTYYGFFYDTINSCASAVLQVTLTLNTSPSAGTDVNAFVCNSTDTGGSTGLDLDDQLTGADAGGTWAITTDPSGSLTIGAGNVVDFTGLAANSVYVFTYTTNSATPPCINASAVVTVSVTDCTCPAGNIAPVLDTSVHTAFCDVISQNLNEYTKSTPPTGTTLTWSTNPDPTVVRAHIGSDVNDFGTYYGFFYDAANNCASPVLTITLTKNDTPKVLATTPGSRCGTGSVTLEATRTPGAVLNWYDSDAGGTFLGTGTGFVTPSISTTTAFYVEATANGCISERTPVLATVYEQPNAGVANNTSACSIAGGFTTVDLNSRLTGADPGTWAITTVPTGAMVTIGTDDVVDFTGQPDGDYIFTYTTNTAQASCESSTALTVSVSSTDCSPDNIDLELTKEVDKNPIDVGGQVTFTLTLTNLSEVQVSNITVSDPIISISSGFGYVSSAAPKGTTYNKDSGDWTIDLMEPQETITLQIVASVPVEGIFTNKASITASFPNDGNLINNESSVDVEVLPTVCLRIFNQISPNGDGINDELIINCIRNYKNNKLEIFDRYGNKVFSTTNYDNTWSGTGKNGNLPKGTYFYSLDLGDGSAARTGWIQIIR